MDSNLEVIRSIYENECQRIVECKEIKTEEKFIYNIIFNQKLIKLIDINTLNAINSNIIKCQKTEDRLYIVTKHHELNNQKLLKDYINSNNLTLRQQFSITQQLINLFIQIYKTTDLLQYKVLNFNNLSVSEDNVLFVNGYFEFKDEYDLSDNYSYRNLGHMIHYVFSKEEIVDYNISDTIPPDVLKIIVKCLTREYFHPKDTLKELENSPIYSIINCNTTSYATDKKLFNYDTECNNTNNTTKAAAKISVDHENNSINIVSNIVPDNLDDIPLDLDENIDSDPLGENPAELLKDEILENPDETSLNSSDEPSLNNGNDLPLKNPDEFFDEIKDEPFESLDEPLDEPDEDEPKVIDIFLSDGSSKDKGGANNYLFYEDEEDSKIKKVMKFAIPLVMLVFVFAIGFFVIKTLYKGSEQANADNVNVGNNTGKDDEKKPDDPDKTDKPDESNPSNDGEEPSVSLDNSKFKLYFSDEIINKIAYSGKAAVLDTEVYSTGKNSLLIENDSTETEKIFFASIDFTDKELSYMKNNTVVITPVFKALKDLDAKLIVEAYQNGKLMTNKTGKISIPDDIWIKNGINVVTDKIDRINLYLEFTGKNKVWLDNISIDLLK